MQQPRCSAQRDEFNGIPWPTRFAHNSSGDAYGSVDNGTGCRSSV